MGVIPHDGGLQCAAGALHRSRRRLAPRRNPGSRPPSVHFAILMEDIILDDGLPSARQRRGQKAAEHGCVRGSAVRWHPECTPAGANDARGQQPHEGPRLKATGLSPPSSDIDISTSDDGLAAQHRRPSAAHGGTLSRGADRGPLGHHWRTPSVLAGIHGRPPPGCRPKRDMIHSPMDGSLVAAAASASAASQRPRSTHRGQMATWSM